MAYTVQHYYSKRVGDLFRDPDARFWLGASGGGAVTTLTTTGSSGAATLVAGTLNIPNYSGGASPDSVQTYTSGSTLTQTTGANYIQVNPASNQSTLTITTATAANFHASNDLYIVVGGTLNGGSLAVTTFTLTAGAGITIVQAVTPTQLNAGETLRYHLIGTTLYRIN